MVVFHYGAQAASLLQEAYDVTVERDLVFTTQTGNIVNPNNLRNRSFKPLLKETGLPGIRFHDLRHTNATLLL